MSSISQFNGTMFVSEQLNRQMINCAQELAIRVVKSCGEHYNFDSEEAIRLLCLMNIKVDRKMPEKSNKSRKEKAVKMAFPLPYNGGCAVDSCSALRQNQGLYTQCSSSPKKGGVFCKQCQMNADNNNGVPEYGTIDMRNAVGIFEYVDPKGRKPVAYTKLMKKYKVDQATVIEEALKFGININAEHFIAPVDTSKGRPKKEKVQAKEKGTKGRPKKAKKVLMLEGDDDDLFASLVADANTNVVVEPAKKRGKSDEDKAAEEAKKAQVQQEKEAKRLQEKAEKEAKLAAEKAEKEAKLAAEKAEKEAKLAADKFARDMKKQKEEEQNLAKKIASELAKVEKEAKLAAEKAAKEAKKKPAAAAKPAFRKGDKVLYTKTSSAAIIIDVIMDATSNSPDYTIRLENGKEIGTTSAYLAPEPEPEEEPDVVKKIEFEGNKYLKSKKTGVVYDYTEYVKNGEQVVIGKWNDASNKIDFNKTSDEEEEEEYSM
jgi:chemotaxis protein histidine kinase CheA